MDYLSHNIAINLKKIRKAKGMSLDVVAEQTGVSKSMLATIEKGDANPSIGVLGKIMSGLRIDLQDLTQAPQNDSYLVDVGKLEPTKYVEGQYSVWTCFPIADNRSVEIYRIDIEVVSYNVNPRTNQPSSRKRHSAGNKNCGIVHGKPKRLFHFAFPLSFDCVLSIAYQLGSVNPFLKKIYDARFRLRNSGSHGICFCHMRDYKTTG